MSILATQDTRVIVQGITGREATAFTKDMMDYGTRVVAGVTPGKKGQSVYGVPVFDTVRQALKAQPADASVISVPPALVQGAALEALENGIRLLVIVSERVPRRDTVEILEIARERGARVIGPNTLGLISPGRIKLGMAGGPVDDVRKAYMPGPVGIASRSGGMTTEVANLLTTNGIGQSTCIGIGGDPVVGANFLDLIPLFEQDPETKAVVLFSEPGGVIEEHLAEYVLENRIRTPIVAFIAGRFVDEMPGVRFGHAATIVEGDRGSARGKIERLREAGIHVADAFSDIVRILKERIRDEFEMKLNPVEEKIWRQVSQDLANERVASPDHVQRMTEWCQRLGPEQGADMESLVAGALVHDVGVLTDRKLHYLAGKPVAEKILRDAGLPEEKIAPALHVLESHSRYGGPDPASLEARVGQDADALEYIGAIGILRAVVRGLTDGSFNGRISDFPDYLGNLLKKVEGTFHTEAARRIGTERIAYMRRFLERVESELGGKA